MPQIAGVIVNLALNLSLAKGWADRVPNVAVVVLYIVSLLPVIYWIVTHEKALRQREWLNSRFRDHQWSSLGISVVLGVMIVSTVVVVAPRLWKLVTTSTGTLKPIAKDIPQSGSAPVTRDDTGRQGTSTGGTQKTTPSQPSVAKKKPESAKATKPTAKHAQQAALQAALPKQVVSDDRPDLSNTRRILEDGNIYENQPNKLEVKDPGTTFTSNTVRNMDAGVSNGAAASNNLFEGRSNTGHTGLSQPENHSNGANMEAIRVAQTRNQYPGGFPDTPPATAATPSPVPIALQGSNSAVADQLLQFIDAAHEIVADFLKDDNSQRIGEKEKAWEAEARAILVANLGQRFADQFSSAVSTSTAYPPGHNAQGGSICNLIDSKIAILSVFVNQLRTPDR
jgi:hypothetical protein